MQILYEHSYTSDTLSGQRKHRLSGVPQLLRLHHPAAMDVSSIQCIQTVAADHLLLLAQLRWLCVVLQRNSCFLPFKHDITGKLWRKYGEIVER